MKRSAFFLVAAMLLVGRSAFSDMQATQSQLDSWSAFNNAHGNLWQITWDAFGMPSGVIGGTVSPQGTSSEQIARNFLIELASAFTLQDPNQQLQSIMVDTSRLDENFVVHVTFREILNGFPVFDCPVKVHISQDGAVHYSNAIACRLDNPVDYSQIVLSRASAIAAATAAIAEGQIESAGIVTDSGYVRTESTNLLVWRVIVPTHEPWHEWQVTVRQNGTVMRVRDIMVNETGLAKVYLDHPFAGDTQQVTLQRLDGSHYLRGDHADVTNHYYGQAYEADNDFRYNPWEHHFDDANVYYHIDFAQGKAMSLGFPYYHAMRCTVNVYWDNAGYYPSSEEIVFGNGAGKLNDLAREASVIYHEYGHHISDKKVPSWPDGGFDYDVPQAGAISEAVSDYFGCSWTNDPDHGEYTAASHPDLQRHLENAYHYPEDYHSNDPHFSSQLLSGPLWEIRQALAPTWGYAVTDKLVLGTLDNCLPNETFTNFWKHIVLADQNLRYSRDLERIQWEFQQRGFTPPANTAPHIDSVFFCYTPISSPDTIFEGRSYTVRAKAHQNGSPDGAWLKYDWMGDGNFSGSGYPYPPDTLISYRAPVHQPWETPPVLRTIYVMVYDGLGGVDEYDLNFLVYECNCGRTTTLRMWADVSNDNAIGPEDVVRMVKYVYQGQQTAITAPPGTTYPNAPLPAVPPFTCQYRLGDANRDGAVGPGDVIRYVNYVYKSQTTAILDNPCGP